MSLRRVATSIQPVIVLSQGSGDTITQRLFAAIRGQILEGNLLPGTKLPGSRELASQLGIGRNTVLAAYTQLHAEGYLTSNKRSGTFVTPHIPERSLSPSAARSGEQRRYDPIRNKRLPNRFRAPRLYERVSHALNLDFRIGRPDPSLFPLAQWRRHIETRLSGANSQLTRYGNPAGLRDLRATLAKHLHVARGIRANPDQILIVRGCQEGLNIIARLFSGPLSTACVEDPCYRGAAFAFDGFGYKVIPVPIDEEGIVVERLPTEATLVCVTPSHQFPMGATMSLRRRIQLLEWSRLSGAYIVEDDYDSDFRYNGSPLTALAGLDNSRNVIYVGTFSKSLGAGIRLGYLVLPEELVSAAIDLKGVTDNGTSWLEQAALRDFMDSGSFARHLRRVMKTYKERRDCLIAAITTKFDGWEISGQDGGMHIAALLPLGMSAQALQFKAIDLGVGIYSLVEGPAIDFENTQFRDRALFFGYPCLSTEKISEATDRLARVVDQLAG